MEEYKSNRIRSGMSKGLIIFLSIMLGSSLGMLVPIILVPVELPLKIIGYILCGTFGSVSLVVLVDHLFDYVFVKDDYICKVILFYRKKEKIKNITKIRHEEGFYTIYVKGGKFTTLSDRDPATTKMLFQFEKHGVDLTRVEK